MDHVLGRANPVRRLTGLALVLLLHVAIVYALVTGLAKHVIDVVREPIETKVIEEPKPKPPPPPQLAIPPPEFAAPPPPFIPPPEVKIAQPPPPPVVAVTHTPPPAPVAITPAPAPPKPAPAPVTASIACANYHTAMGDAAFPREALRRGIERGEALIQFTLTADGRVTDVEAVRASNPVFAHASEAIVAKFQCRGQGRDVVVRVPFDYRVE